MKKQSVSEILIALELCAMRIPIGSLWQHYKDGQYVVVAHDVDTDTGLIRVAYRRVAASDFSSTMERNIRYSRPCGEWFDAVENSRSRFTRLE